MKKLFASFSMLVILSMLSGCVSPLNIWAPKGNIKAIKDYLDNGGDVNEVLFRDRTALMYASANGHTDLVKFLIERGADVNISSGPPKYYCALGYAAARGHTDIMDILVDRGANIDMAIKNIQEFWMRSDAPQDVSQSGVNYLYKLKKKAHYNAELAKLGEFEAVARPYRESKQKPSLPEEALKYKAQAEFAIKQKRFADAADRYANALNIAPWWPEGHFNRGLILGMRELSRYTEAIMEMKKYLLLAPNAPNARSAQDKIYQWEDMIK